MSVQGRLHPVDLIVRGHDAADAAVADHHLEMATVALAQRLLRQDGVLDGAVLLDVVRGEVGGATHDMLLQAGGEGGGHATDEVAVFAVGFLRSAPERMAHHVHAGREQDVVLRGSRLVAHGAAHPPLEIEIPRRCAQRRCREMGRVVLVVVRSIVLAGVQVHPFAPSRYR
jgi:hypothetical protein